MQKPLAIALFLAIIFMPYAPLVSFPAKAEASAGDITYFDNPGSSLWTVPANVHTVTVKVWGAGAAAGNGEKINNHNRASLGGGAGGYTEKTISVTPGQTYLVDVGAGGQGILSVQEGRLGRPGQESKFEGNAETLRATGGSGGATAVGFGNPMDPIGFGGIGDGGNGANNQGGGNSSPATWDGDNWDASNGGSAYAGGNGGSRGRLGRDGQGHCGSAPCDWAQDGQFPGGGGGGSDTGVGGYGANGRVTIEEVDAKPYGFVDGADCSSIGGWAYDPDEPSVSIGVHFYVDSPAGGVWLGNTTANVPRPDINAINIPGDHGFNFAIPNSLKDGQTHKIYAYGINSNPADPNNNNAVLISSADNVSDFRTISGCTIPPSNQAPTNPQVSGVTTGSANAYLLTIAISTDPDGDQIKYGFDWDNNGLIDEYTAFSASGVGVGISHLWPTVGNFTFKVYAVDSQGNQSGATSYNMNVTPVVVSSGISSISLSLVSNTAVIPFGGSVQLVGTSMVGVTGPASLTNHGTEVRVNGGAWVNAGAWNNPIANTVRTTDASFTGFNLTSAGTYDFRSYGSIDNGNSYTYSSLYTVTATVTGAPVSTLNSVSIAVTPNPAVIPNGGSVQISVTSTATVTGPTALTNHGIEARFNGGAWVNAGAWNNPISNTLRSSDASFTSLNISVAGTYDFRTYGSINNGTSYIYSNIITVPVTGTVPPTTTINSVSIAVTPNPITIPFGGSVQAVVTSMASVTGPGALVQHGIEMRVNGGAWTSAGTWTAPAGNSLRTSDVSFTALNLTTSGTYDFRTFGSLGGLNRVDSSIVTVVVTVGAPPVVPTLNSVSITVNPNPVVVPNGGSVQVVVTSTAAVSGGAVLTNHGVEMSVNGGAFTNAGAWNNPIATTLRTSDASFTALNLTTAGTYVFRTYGSINGVNYVYSSPITVPVTVSSNHAPVVSGVVGPTTGLVNTSYLFTATATDVDGDAIRYGFDWNNNGTIDTLLGESWTPAVASGVPVGRSNIWTTNGAQSFQVLVQDTFGAISSFPFTITISGGASNIGFTLATSTGGFSTSESGGTAVFTVVLNSAPIANVTLPIISSDFTEGTTSVTSLLFTTTNWNVPQPVTITGVDDLLFDGNISYNVTIGPSTSSDVNYNNLAGQSVPVVNTDNEINSSTGGSVSSFSVNPGLITSGNSATLTWTANNATLCTASGSWSGNQNPTGGSLNVGPYITSSTVINTYVITCGNANGTTTQSLTLTIAPTGGGGGSSSGGSSGSGACFGFGCSSVTTTTNSDILIDTSSSGGGSIAPSTTKACPSVDFITTFMRAGIENNPNEVKKLQYFLNKYDSRTLEISGIFDTPTEDAVKAFQVSHANEVLLPWNTDVPTGIVYITTTAAINRIFCADNPTYSGDNDLKDIINPVLYTPVDNSSQFEGVIGAATSSTSTNLASVFGAISGDILGLLKGIPWYELLILLLILLGSGFIVQALFKKDITSPDNTASFVQGISMLAIGSVLNVLNTLSFMIKPDWFTTHIGMNPSWLLGIDAINLIATVVICLGFLIVIHRKLLTSSAK